jgi:pilus assembly protein CpaC
MLIDALQRQGCAKVLAEPVLITMSGRPATFSSGKDVPVPTALGEDRLAVEFRRVGTTVAVVPVVLGNGKIRVELRPEITAIDKSASRQVGAESVPGFWVRWLDTAFEVDPGQTVAVVGGFIQNHQPPVTDIQGPAKKEMEGTEAEETELIVLATTHLVKTFKPVPVQTASPAPRSAAPPDAYEVLPSPLPVANPDVLPGFVPQRR